MDSMRGHSRPLVSLLVLVLASQAVVAQLSWWQSSIIYQVYPRSFKDSDGDGVGDLNGIASKLDYFNYLGVDTYWLSPIYQSPMRDFGYDISNYTNVDPIFGTLQDFEMLVNNSHAKGLNVILDYVPGHTSTDHVWFNKSVNREGNFTNYYVWDNGTVVNGVRQPPNNWLSVFGGSAWMWNEVRQQYYYHAFLAEQADLNYRDMNVQEEMRNVLRFWLERGVDGFRVDALPFLYEVANLSMNEPLSGRNVSNDTYEYLSPIYTTNLPEVETTLASWVDVLNEFKVKDGKDRWMVVETYQVPKIRNRMYDVGADPFNFDLLSLPANPTGYDIRDLVNNEYDNLPSGKWPNFVLGNHDNHRLSHKFGAQYCDVYNMLLLTLWGTPTTYYGEEIGMLEGIISFNDTKDYQAIKYGPDGYEEYSRDPERTPLQWTGGPQAGFTSGNETWLPLGQNYTTINIETQQNSTMSSIKLYSQLARLRKMPVFQTGTFQVAYVSKNIYSYSRERNQEKYLVILNVGSENETRDFTLPYFTTDSMATVVAFTPGLSGMSGLTPESSIDLHMVTLNPGDGLLLRVSTPDLTVSTNNPTSTTYMSGPTGLHSDASTSPIITTGLHSDASTSPIITTGLYSDASTSPIITAGTSSLSTTNQPVVCATSKNSAPGSTSFVSLIALMSVLIFVAQDILFRCRS